VRSQENENAVQLSSGDAYMLELNVIPYDELNELMLFAVSGRRYVTCNSSSAEVSVFISFSGQRCSRMI